MTLILLNRIYIFISDGDLEPYTEYHYFVVAVNGAGNAQSDTTIALTNQALPEGVHPPTATVQEGRLDIIYLTWKEPDRPNGTQ